jgi:hypothetical protein
MFTNLWYNESAASSNSNFELDLNLNKEAIYEKIRLLHAIVGFDFIDASFIELFRIDASKTTSNCKYLSERNRSLTGHQSR